MYGSAETSESIQSYLAMWQFELEQERDQCWLDMEENKDRPVDFITQCLSPLFFIHDDEVFQINWWYMLDSAESWAVERVVYVACTVCVVDEESWRELMLDWQSKGFRGHWGLNLADKSRDYVWSLRMWEIKSKRDVTVMKSSPRSSYKVANAETSLELSMLLKLEGRV